MLEPARRPVRIEAASPEAYIASLDEPRRGEVEQLHRLVRRTAPALEPVMAFGMIGYGLYSHEYRDGRTGEWVLLGLASQKRHISLYAACESDDGNLVERYASRLPKADIGKSCIRIRRLADVDPAVLEEFVSDVARIGVPAR